MGDDGILLHSSIIHHPGRGDGGLACSPEDGDSAVGEANGGSPRTTTGREAEAAAVQSDFLRENKDWTRDTRVNGGGIRS